MTRLSITLVLLFAVAFQQTVCKCLTKNGDISENELDEGRLFAALLASKLGLQQQQQLFLPVVPQPAPILSTTAPLTATPITPVGAGTGVGITSVFTTPTNVAVPAGAAAIGGPGPGLSSDDPDFGEDGAFLRNKLRENYSNVVSDQYDDNEILLEDLINKNQKNVNMGRADPDKLVEQNAALKRKLKRDRIQYQNKQRRDTIRRRNRARARQRAQRARTQALRQRQRYRENRVRQESINRKRRRNLRRGPARRKILRRVIV